MRDDSTMSLPDQHSGPPPWPKTIVIQQRSFLWLAGVLFVLLLMSGLMNLVLLAVVSTDGTSPAAPRQVYVSGDRSSDERIAILNIEGTISPPFTDRWIRTIRAVAEDDTVKGVVLRIDSPGGLVADSHQIYHELNRLREKSSIPIYVSMARIAASGGYYVAMGAGPQGRIFAEPTTWTGSIGVIMPRYNAANLAGKIGVEADPLVTGKFKDTLSPLRDMTAEERELWQEILNDSFIRFKEVILSGRANLNEEKLDALATGQVFTSQQAKFNGLVDAIGFQDDVTAALAKELGLEDPQIVRYEHPSSLMDLLTGSVKAQSPAAPWDQLLGPQTPQALYYCGSPGIGLLP
ncbi:MAG: signal peptide peptidase SppA [Planctomycetaceae bacterium]|nr:signal peptide peptidase SppA [Planctomycetaceae bacterium]